MWCWRTPSVEALWLSKFVIGLVGYLSVNNCCAYKSKFFQSSPVILYFRLCEAGLFGFVDDVTDDKLNVAVTFIFFKVNYFSIWYRHILCAFNTKTLHLDPDKPNSTRFTLYLLLHLWMPYAEKRTQSILGGAHVYLVETCWPWVWSTTGINYGPLQCTVPQKLCSDRGTK